MAGKGPDTSWRRSYSILVWFMRMAGRPGLSSEDMVLGDQVRQWLERSEASGVDGLKPRSIHQKYTEAFKLEIVQKYLAGYMSYPALAQEYGIPDNSVIVQWGSLYTSGQSLQTTGRARPMKDGRKTTQIERIEITQWTIANDYNYGAAAQRRSNSRSLMGRYTPVKKFKQGFESALEDRRARPRKTMDN